MTVFVAVFACLGGYTLISSFASTPAALFEPPNGDVYIGVSTDHNVSTGGTDRLPLFDQTAGIAKPAIFNEYTSPDGSFSKTIANATQGPTMTPMVSWNIPFDNSQITNGSQDTNIAARIAEVKAFGKPIFLRPDWEFNGTWSPHWDNPAVTPAQYIASWQYIVTKFHQAGVTNAAFVWCPNVLDYFDSSGTRFRTSQWYPGDSYVDWVGLDSYPQSNTQDNLLNGTDGMNQMAQFAASHNKPLALTEWALNTPHPDDPTVVDWVLAWQDSYPNTVKANMWFDFVTQGKDFTLAVHPLAAAEFKSKLAYGASKYLYSVVDNSKQPAPTPAPTPTPAPSPSPAPTPTGNGSSGSGSSSLSNPTTPTGQISPIQQNIVLGALPAGTSAQYVIDGKVVTPSVSKGKTTIDTSHLSPGTHYLETITTDKNGNKNTSYNKIVIQKQLSIYQRIRNDLEVPFIDLYNLFQNL